MKSDRAGDEVNPAPEDSAVADDPDLSEGNPLAHTSCVEDLRTSRGSVLRPFPRSAVVRPGNDIPCRIHIQRRQLSYTFLQRHDRLKCHIH